ncbi:MAG: NUDIX hydrolase [Acidobacteriota bacterium]
MDPDLFYRRKKVPRVTVDAWIRDEKGRLLLIRRGRPPFTGRWGLPGGFLDWKERAEDCCAREALEETGLEVAVGKLLGVYSDADRDPRGHNVTILYDAAPLGGKARGGDDASEARWFSEKELEDVEFAFDHRRIVTEQLARRSRRRAPRTGGPSRSARRAASRG